MLRPPEGCSRFLRAAVSSALPRPLPLRMSRALRIALVTVAVPLVAVGLVASVFALDRASDDGEILGNVSFEGVPLAGLEEDEALQAITAVKERLASIPVHIDIEGTEFTLLPSAVGYDFDVESIVSEAMAIGRDGGMTTQLRWWFDNLGGGDEATLGFVPTYDRAAVVTILRRWEPQAIQEKPLEGGITFQNGEIVPVYPRSGIGIDFDATADLIGTEVLAVDKESVVAATEFRSPAITTEDIDRLVLEAQRLIAEPVTLAKIVPDTSVTFPTEVLLRSLTSRASGTTENPGLELFFQIGPLVEFLDPIREQVELPPTDAQVVIRPDDVPLILPGSNSLLIDDGSLPDAVMQAATSVTRTAPLPVKEGTEPEFTTEDAEALGIRELLYTATTFFPCCGDQKNLNRINNIHRIADETDGAIVMPGETFSLNDHVGERTEEDGYRRAGAIIGPKVECCDHPANVGGGVSQFTTTLYNAIYWAGLEDVDHKPHTLYFSRYPLVREATLGFPSPDLVFRNNTENAVYLKTEYTDTSVSVKVFGDNGGLTVESTTSDRFNFVDPFEVFEGNDTLAPGTQEVVDEGEPGFTASVTRTITYPDGDQVTQTWSWVYHPFPIVVEVHPCELPDDDEDYVEECPVEVPNLLGHGVNFAQQELNKLGLVLVIGDPIIVSGESVGKIVEQTPRGGNLVEAGAEVVIHIGVAG